MTRTTAPAIVHEYFIQDGGAELCAIELAALLPTATVHTTFFDAGTFGSRLAGSRVQTWFLQRIVGPTRRFRGLLPLYAVYFTLKRIPSSSLVVSSSIAFTKAVRTSPASVHIAYVYTPIRYAWDLDTYLEGSSYGWLARIAARTIRPVLQEWDRRTSSRPDLLVAISETVRQRIRERWGRDSEVIYPPVDVSQLQATGEDEGFYLVAARLLAYRRVDIAIEACTQLGRRLLVVGDGPERPRLESLAGPSVEFVGHVDRARLVRYFETCRAYLVPGIEDFGIAPVEAMAAGKPVIALASGGAAETVVDGITGMLVEDATADAFADAMRRAERMAWNPDRIRARAEEFDRSIFLARWRALIERVGQGHQLSAAMIAEPSEPRAETA